MTVHTVCSLFLVALTPWLAWGDNSETATEKTDMQTSREQFTLWASSCSHVHTDKRVAGRESLGDAIRQSECGGDDGGQPFEWDIALHLGDISGSQTPPTDEEGPEVIHQFAAARKHRREQFYTIAGNHDASGPGEECQWWFRKWLDPEGKNTRISGVDASRRPYPIDGTWERYSFRVGNILFLMMSDRNDGGPPAGRGQRGGYPAGAVTKETFKWWKRMIEENPDSIIISAHHHMLKETTVASGPWEGFRKKPDGGWTNAYHGYFPKGAPEGASYLYFVDDKPDAQAFEGYLAEHPGAIDIWLGGHTHTNPDDRAGGRSHIETRWGVHFVNVAALTRRHGPLSVPMSRLLVFTDGGDQVLVKCYLHTSDYKAQGWYAPAERALRLSRPFRRNP